MNGQISRLIPTRVSDSSKGDDGREYFVHRTAICGEVFERLQEGQPVAFDPGQGDKGPRAPNVRLG